MPKSRRRTSEQFEGTNAHLVEVGQKAEYVVVVGLYKNGKPAFRYQRVPLDHRFADAPEIHQMQVEYQHELQNLGLERSGAESDAAFDRPQVCREQDVRRRATRRRRPCSKKRHTRMRPIRSSADSRRGISIPSA